MIFNFEKTVREREKRGFNLNPLVFSKRGSSPDF